jgi:hypothetical protein
MNISFSLLAESFGCAAILVLLLPKIESSNGRLPSGTILAQKQESPEARGLVYEFTRFRAAQERIKQELAASS